MFREPQVAIGSSCDSIWARAGCDADTELGDYAGRGDPPNPVAVQFREPKVTIGASCDSIRARAGCDAETELGDYAGRGDPRDPVTEKFREPQVAIGSSRDGRRPRVGRNAGAEFGYGWWRRRGGVVGCHVLCRIHRYHTLIAVRAVASRPGAEGIPTRRCWRRQCQHCVVVIRPSELG